MPMSHKEKLYASERSNRRKQRDREEHLQRAHRQKMSNMREQAAFRERLASEKSAKKAREDATKAKKKEDEKIQKFSTRALFEFEEMGLYQCAKTAKYIAKECIKNSLTPAKIKPSYLKGNRFPTIKRMCAEGYVASLVASSHSDLPNYSKLVDIAAQEDPQYVESADDWSKKFRACVEELAAQIQRKDDRCEILLDRLHNHNLLDADYVELYHMGLKKDLTGPQLKESKEYQQATKNTEEYIAMLTASLQPFSLKKD